jgi:hypothetical protein
VSSLHRRGNRRVGGPQIDADCLGHRAAPFHSGSAC